jgi:hypothetical protein
MKLWEYLSHPPWWNPCKPFPPQVPSSPGPTLLLDWRGSDCIHLHIRWEAWRWGFLSWWQRSLHNWSWIQKERILKNGCESLGSSQAWGEWGFSTRERDKPHKAWSLAEPDSRNSEKRQWARHCWPYEGICNEFLIPQHTSRPLEIDPIDVWCNLPHSS